MSLELASAGVLAAWFALSVICQLSGGAIGRAADRVKARDAAGLIPQWAFFAPNPGVTDHHLLYRDRGAVGEVTPWRDAHVAPRARWSRGVWNPGKRAEKAVVDATYVLLRHAREGGDARLLPLTVPYLLLLEHVSALPEPGLATARQFMVMATSGAGAVPARPVLVSGWHRLPPRVAGGR